MGQGELYGGIETGGTWWVVAVGTGPQDIRHIERYPTSDPDTTINRAIAFLTEHGPVRSVGVGSFGPVDVNPASATWGHITSTPKPGWADTPVASSIADALGVPVGWDTDVTVAALGEHTWGAARNLRKVAYVTVGTGVGAGLILDDVPVTGPGHPEAGHLPVRHDGRFAGTCPFHGDCLEGLVSGPALQARWGVQAADLPDDHEAWDHVVDALAQLVMALRLTAAVELVVLSGAVGRRPAMAGRVHARALEINKSYVTVPGVVAPQLGDRAGVLGAIELARRTV